MGEAADGVQWSLLAVASGPSRRTHLRTQRSKNLKEKYLIAAQKLFGELHGTPEFPPGPTKSVDGLPDCVNGKHASSTRPTTFAWCTVKKRWRTSMEGCSSWWSRNHRTGTAKTAERSLSGMPSFIWHLFDSTSFASTSRTHGKASLNRMETSRVNPNCSINYKAEAATVTTKTARGHFASSVLASCFELFHPFLGVLAKNQ